MTPPEKRSTPPESMAAVAGRFDSLDTELAAIKRQQNASNGELYKLLEEVRDAVAALGVPALRRELADHEGRLLALETDTTEMANGHG